ncbi:MAG: SUMF1/EgtB/PvdO family nonheme iron enzyme [Bacteroidaceae bacterium]|nr:SUMF1/EgtB/PvdO family nonheme iron enzyme [Bacteroidaceae bacterium]
MKLLKRFSLLLAATVLTSAVQAQVINGDLNHNDGLDVEDVTLLIDGYLSGETEQIQAGGEPYGIDNSLVSGTWYRTKTDKFTLEADGTTDYGTGYTYQFMPLQGTILFYNAAGNAVAYLKVLYVPADKSRLVVKAPGTDDVWTYYDTFVQRVESITLSATTLSLDLDGYEKLTATVLPSDAENLSVVWSSSDETVVTVSQKGLVEAVGEGTAIITCTAADGSGVKATCEVTVGNQSPTPQPGGTTTYTVNGVSFKMVSVSGGTFLMGAQNTDSSSSNYDADAYDYEAPVHNVTLSDYSIGETEVTQALWKAVMGTNPSYWLGDNLPVEKVSWNDCQEFITKLNQATGKTFRLPTEAEWEFAARGGTKSHGYKYSGSNTTGDVAWYSENSGDKTHEVGTKQANELGLYDMSGNVWEWCSDWYGNYSSSAQSDPTGPTTGSYRVGRDGSWSSTARNCRVTYRNGYGPTSASRLLGFRLALSSSTTR